MKLHQKPLGMIRANCYILATEQNNAVVIDPGGEASSILAFCQKHGYTVKLILLTHGHHDHMAAVWELSQATQAEVAIHGEDLEMLMEQDKCLCSSPPYFDFHPMPFARALRDREVLSVDEITIEVIHTPGHSKGSCCYRVGELLFTGDTLFHGTIGRCDLYGGDLATMMQSLQKLKTLPDALRVLPGHEGESKLQWEKKYNPYMRERHGNFDF